MQIIRKVSNQSSTLTQNVTGPVGSAILKGSTGLANFLLVLQLIL